MLVAMKMMGGLGNQMFQYAFGRALSVKYNCPLYLDLARYYQNPKGDTPRSFDLNCYEIKGNTFRSDDISPFLFHRFPKGEQFLKGLSQIGVNLLPSYCGENTLDYSSDYTTLNNKRYFAGYWQSPKYFEEIKDLIRDDFVPIDLSDSEKELALKIAAGPSVAIHIRRGDYITNEHAHKNHFVCDLDYYKKAISIIEEKNQRMSYYFFSDDPAWAKEEFRHLDNVFFIDGYDKRPWIDLYLMNHCHHFIIANSSFSWWGAWLCIHLDAQVIAPKKWFADGREMNDLIPNHWFRL